MKSTSFKLISCMILLAALPHNTKFINLLEIVVLELVHNFCL